MKKRVEKIAAISLAVLGYVAPVGVGVWRVLRSKNNAGGFKASVQRPETSQDGEDAERSSLKLVSLSRSTPGDAPLDRLARMAAREKRIEDQPEHYTSGLQDPFGSESPRAPDADSVAALLDNQSLASYQLEGWNTPAPERLPLPTYSPAIMAFGIVVFAMGLATTWYVCLGGAAVFAVAAWRWVGELQGE